MNAATRTTHKMRILRHFKTPGICFPVGRPHFGHTKASVEMGVAQSGQS